MLPTARGLARQIHAFDPEMILQAGIYEIITTDVERLRVPARVFREFDLPAEQRHFRYADMLYRDGHGKDHWRRNASVPDMSRLETQMWFFSLAASYIDTGCEALHMGQVEIMDDADPEHSHWFALLQRIRRYASKHARRHWVLCDAHVPSVKVPHGFDQEEAIRAIWASDTGCRGETNSVSGRGEIEVGRE